MRTSPEINELAKAMSLAQAAMKPALKDSTNPHFKSRYSDLTSIWESIRAPLTSNGLTVWQDVTVAEGAIMVTTRIVHQSGQYCEFGPFPIIPKDKTAHSFGSAVSYAKRYSLSAALGIVSDEDDDGNAANFGKETVKATEMKGTTEPVTPSKKYAGYAGPTLSNQQVTLILSLVGSDAEYMGRLIGWMQALGVDGLKSLPVAEFEPLKARILERAKLKEEVGF